MIGDNNKQVLIIDTRNDVIESEFSLNNALIENTINRSRLIDWKEKNKIKKDRNFIRNELGDFVKMYLHYTEKLIKDKDMHELDIKLLLYIVKQYGKQNGYDYTMETHAEFAKELDFSHIAVQKSLKKLVSKGYLLDKVFGRNKRYAPNPYFFFKEGAKEQIEAIAELKKEKDIELWSQLIKGG